MCDDPQNIMAAAVGSACTMGHESCVEMLLAAGVNASAEVSCVR